MRYLSFVLCLIVVSAQGQAPREGRTTIRQQATDLLMNVYRRPEVQKICETAREATVRLNGPGSEFTVSCDTRREYLQIVVEFYHRPEVEKACGDNPGESTIARVLGNDVPVDCRTRDADLTLLEPWLTELKF